MGNSFGTTVLQTIDADLVVNGVTDSWILDTGANFDGCSLPGILKRGEHEMVDPQAKFPYVLKRRSPGGSSRSP